MLTSPSVHICTSAASRNSAIEHQLLLQRNEVRLSGVLSKYLTTLPTTTWHLTPKHGQLDNVS